MKELPHDLYRRIAEEKLRNVYEKAMTTKPTTLREWALRSGDECDSINSCKKKNVVDVTKQSLLQSFGKIKQSLMDTIMYVESVTKKLTEKDTTKTITELKD